MDWLIVISIEFGDESPSNKILILEINLIYEKYYMQPVITRSIKNFRKNKSFILSPLGASSCGNKHFP